MEYFGAGAGFEYKIGKKISSIWWYWNWETEYKSFHSCKGPITIDDKDVKKILINKEFLYTKILKNGKKKIFKYFIGYKNDEKLDQLPQMSWYGNSFIENKYISFMIKDDQRNE